MLSSHIDFFRPLYAAHSIDVNGRLYLHYEEFAHACGCSTHMAQARRRERQYPLHFIRINGRLYISTRYAHALRAHQLSAAQLRVLQTEGGEL